MEVADLLDPEWDSPFFKRLSKNDSGKRKGHQAGLVVPKSLVEFFPDLERTVDLARQPTADRALDIELFIGDRVVQHPSVRFQFQTWAGTRTPEHRVTQFKVLDAYSQPGDILVMQRRRSDLTRFRLMLCPAALADRELPTTKGRRWGILYPNMPPLTQAQFVESLRALTSEANEPFVPFVERSYRRSASLMAARSMAFSVAIRRSYDWTCAVSGIRLDGPTGDCEVEAAHLIPVECGGADDLRNGLALTRTLHWAFDQHLFGITEDGRVFVPKDALRDGRNGQLAVWHGKPLSNPNPGAPRPHEVALGWHRARVLEKWLRVGD